MKRLRLAVLVFWIFSAMMVLVACATIPNEKDFLMPPDLKIVAPDPSLPSEVRGLSGKWGGRWTDPTARTGWVDALLVVEAVEKDKATMVYIHGDTITAKRNWSRSIIPISERDNYIIFEIGRIKFNYNIKKDVIMGSIKTMTITMHRVP